MRNQTIVPPVSKGADSTVIAQRPLAAKVEAMAGYGIAPADIARVLAIDEASLAREYADELATGQVKANARVAENLFRKATGEGRESVTAAIFWLKARARWKETSVLDVKAPAMAHEDWLELLWERERQVREGDSAL